MDAHPKERQDATSEHLLVHVPEILCRRFLELIERRRHLLEDFGSVSINIMLQNIDHRPERSLVDKMKLFAEVTITTAHERYSTEETSAFYDAPLFPVSTYVHPGLYRRTTWEEKSNLIAISPDSHPKRDEVIRLLRSRQPTLNIIIIQDMAYEDAKNVFRDAKWSLTFGEGLDSYFVEPTFSGGVAFAVYNDRYFTEEFATLPTVYPSYDNLIENIVDDMDRLDSPDVYAATNRMVFDVCSRLYQYDKYM